MKALRVMLVSEGYGKLFFGVSQVLIRLASRCRMNGHAYRILVVKAEAVPAVDSPYVTEIPTMPASRNLRWHPAQLSFLFREVTNFLPDIVHIHGVMTFVQQAAVAAAIRAGVPVILSSHGMLNPGYWGSKPTLKHVLKRFFWVHLLQPQLSKVDYVHVITEQESEILTKEFPGVKQIRISNAIDLTDYSSEQVVPEGRYMLFLGRLHPIKGLHLLIQAFARFEQSDFRLVVAGPDVDSAYTAQLHAMVKSLGLSERVQFIGGVYGEDKADLLRNAWCSVVPSYSEVVALVNLESAASFTPSITTTMTGLGDWQEGGGLLIEPELEVLCEAIKEVGCWSLDERMEAGRKSREFVKRKYSWDVIGEQWMDAYRIIAESGKRKHG